MSKPRVAQYIRVCVKCSNPSCSLKGLEGCVWQNRMHVGLNYVIHNALYPETVYRDQNS